MTTPRPGPGGRPPGWQLVHARRYIETGGRARPRRGREIPLVIIERA